MNEEELKEMYKGLKRNKKVIGNIDTDFFFEFAETLLNLLENKDKQIEQYQNMLATNDMLHVLECEKKDKMIELMLEEISKNILSTCPLADYNVDLDCENKCKDDYKACWKKYFEYKLEEDK